MCLSLTAHECQFGSQFNDIHDVVLLFTAQLTAHLQLQEE